MTTDIQLYANNVSTTLTSPINAGDLSITVADGSKFPTPSAGQYLLATIEVGLSFEVVRISSRSGNVLTVSASGRGQESTTASSWSTGALIEMRVTKGTLERFARYLDRLFELNSVNDLVAPIQSNANSYITHSNDDAGNPITALRADNNTWKFLTHKRVIVSSGTSTGGTTTTLTSNAIGSLIVGLTSGKYIVQFLNGNLAGQVRVITTTSSNQVGWSGATTEAPSAGVTTFEILQSDTSSLSNAFLPLVGGTVTGPIVLPGNPTNALEAAPKQYVDAATIATVDIVVGSTTFGAGDALKTKVVTAASSLILPLASAVANGNYIDIKSTTTASVTLAPQGSDTLDGDTSATPFRIGSFQECRAMRTATGQWNLVRRSEEMVGDTKVNFVSVLPKGYEWANSLNISRTTFGGLFAVYGTLFGIGDGTTTFGKPDLRGRALFGKDDMGGAAAANRITAGVSGITGTTLASAGGSQFLHQHGHGVNDPGHVHTEDTGGIAQFGGNGFTSGGVHGLQNTSVSTTGISIQNSGSGNSENMPPAMICNWIIKT